MTLVAGTTYCRPLIAVTVLAVIPLAACSIGGTSSSNVAAARAAATTPVNQDDSGNNASTSQVIGLMQAALLTDAGNFVSGNLSSGDETALEFTVESLGTDKQSHSQTWSAGRRIAACHGHRELRGGRFPGCGSRGIQPADFIRCGFGERHNGSPERLPTGEDIRERVHVTARRPSRAGTGGW